MPGEGGRLRRLAGSLGPVDRDEPAAGRRPGSCHGRECSRRPAPAARLVHPGRGSARIPSTGPSVHREWTWRAWSKICRNDLGRTHDDRPISPDPGRPAVTATTRRGHRRGACRPARRSSAVLLVPALAAAHPLGNFTINHYTGIRVEPDRILPRRGHRPGRDPDLPGTSRLRHRRRRRGLRRGDRRRAGGGLRGAGAGAGADRRR